MEYGIYFNDDNANNNVLATLEEVNNTFFIENDSEENTSDSSNHEDHEKNNDINDLEENFNEMHLSNFEFMENPDNFIEDEVYNKLKLKVKEFFRSGKWQLLAFQQDENTKKVMANNRKFLRFKYCFNNNISIYRTTYQNLTERTHGNTERLPKNMKRIEVSYSIACEIYNFLKNYADVHGLPSLGRNFNKISIPVIFLPTSFSYASVYRDYVEACKDKYEEETHINCETTFRDTWKVLMPSLQFISPKSDLCETCETMKLDIQYVTEHEKKLAVTEKYLVHLNRAK
ncbi:hypothetical protein RclHR1_05270012 [Rhizophagus clarus]|uniref:Uncharacterized protein n=1 Tax=Rhizophagus clarus TaxID=94130 RepID=A0A2Z6RS77_9GLOM|nr:hypothetical protein RclHR1_05270012 [Rhizophagus clarus]